MSLLSASYKISQLTQDLLEHSDMPPKTMRTNAEEEGTVFKVRWGEEQDQMLIQEMLQWMYDNRAAIRLLPGPQQWHQANDCSPKVFFQSVINRKVIAELKKLAKQRGVSIDESGTKTRASPTKIKSGKRERGDDDDGKAGKRKGGPSRGKKGAGME
ncbi:hypothetical protein BCV69DRAFT_197416 [Microstroma glucosiphilum]|uniref:Uncharacterized protein n=1 Tax=Pseudomicrostroma glucosiphilum TaxID=1684307 RepID=A0A316U688_9BASI|nr:hypothetical protein BCV69DRAFT_197416 [Pseudomicrostroma glucosiphilum]PWN20720.1 hypothetical protein BCV69DRAFT_197416 [Pseudomicrostroma glucosiphilum]